MRVGSCIAMIVCLAGCGAFNAPDVPGTMRAENTAHVAEASAIAGTLMAGNEYSAATAQAAETTVARTGNVNIQLAATARALIPPTPVRQVGVAAEVAGTPGLLDAQLAEQSQGGSQFVDTGPTTRKRDSDGCADGFETQIPANVERIYVITRALSLSAGTEMRAEWRFDGQVVSQDSWTTPNDQANFCVWFYIDPQTVAFTPGTWSVQLYADAVLIQPEVIFTIVEVM